MFLLKLLLHLLCICILSVRSRNINLRSNITCDDEIRLGTLIHRPDARFYQNDPTYYLEMRMKITVFGVYKVSSGTNSHIMKRVFDRYLKSLYSTLPLADVIIFVVGKLNEKLDKNIIRDYIAYYDCPTEFFEYMELALSRIYQLLDNRKLLYSPERLIIGGISQTLFQADIRRTLLHKIPIGKIIMLTSTWGPLHIEHNFVYERLSKCIFDINEYKEDENHDQVCSFTIFATSSVLVKDSILKIKMFRNTKLKKVSLELTDDTNIQAKENQIILSKQHMVSPTFINALFWRPQTPVDCGTTNRFYELLNERKETYFLIHFPSFVSASSCTWYNILEKRYTWAISTNMVRKSSSITISRMKSLSKTTKLLKKYKLDYDNRNHVAIHLRQDNPSIFYHHTKKDTSRRVLNNDFSCLIVGAGNYQEVGPFTKMLRSIRETGCSCDVTIFTNNATNPIILEIFKKYGAQWIEFYSLIQGTTEEQMAKDTWEVSAKKPAWFRHFLFYSYFRSYGRYHKYVGWIDVRDVIFQDNPMKHLPLRGLTAYTETAIFSLYHKKNVYLDWSINDWNYRCLANYEQYQSYPPINLGVVMGLRESILSALSILICELQQCGGWDQFVFSRILYNDFIDIVPKVNIKLLETGNVANLCSNVDVDIDEHENVINTLGKPYDIVHQYDRFESLNELFSQRYPYNNEIP